MAKTKVLLATLAMMMCVAAAAPARAQSLTVTGAYGSACCTNQQLIWIEGANFLFGVTGYPPLQVKVFALGAAGESRQIQVNYVDTFRVWATTPTLPFVISAFRVETPTINATVNLAGNGFAAPSIRAEGYFAHAGSMHPLGVKFNGVIAFPARSDLGSVILFGSGFGFITDWIVTVEGVSDAGEFISFDFPAQAFPHNSAFGTATLNFQLSGQPAGQYSFVARAPGFQTNAILIRIGRD